MAKPLIAAARFEGRTSRWREREPERRIANAVEALWIGIGGWTHSLSLLPDGAVDIVWDGERLTGVALRDVAVIARVHEAALNVGIRLRCGCAGSILGAPPRLGRTDLAVDWGKLGQHYVLKLHRARDPDDRLDVLQDLIEDRLYAGPGPDPMALAAAKRLGQGDQGSVENLARRLNEDPRSLRRRFSTQVGMSPKRLQRVFRLQALLRELTHSPATADVAARLGFADQAHMIRECRAMTGSTPAALARVLASA